MPSNLPLGTLEHHFLEGQRYHTEQVAEVVTAKNKWRTVTFALLGVVALLVLVCGYLGRLPKQIPYVIERDSSSGALWAIGPAKGLDLAPEATLRYWIREFIVTLRGIGVDLEVLRERWNCTKYRVTPKGRKLLLEYEQEWKPLEQREPNRVEVVHLFRRTPRTYDVRWIERRYSSDTKRELLSTTAYAGQVTFEQRLPSGEQELTCNPAGVFFDWWERSRE